MSDLFNDNDTENLDKNNSTPLENEAGEPSNGVGEKSEDNIHSEDTFNNGGQAPIDGDYVNNNKTTIEASNDYEAQANQINSNAPPTPNNYTNSGYAPTQQNTNEPQNNIPPQNTYNNQSAQNPYMGYNNQANQQPYGTPYYYKGRLYYMQTPYSTPPKKKMATSVKVFLICLISLFAVCFIGLIAFCGYSVMNISNNNYKIIPDFPKSSSSSNSSEKDTQPNLADPNGPSISYNETPNTGDANAQTAFEKLSPSVVTVSEYSSDSSSKSIDDSSNDGLSGQGTGIIISNDGYIVTNSHVIGDTKQNKIVVTLKNGEEYDAVIIGYDTRTDLAVLRIDKTGLQSAEFADSTKISVGQDVIALGNPGGINYSNSLTKGIISALDRTVSSSSVLYIQTDAAINPGNSGGPLANLYGQVIGITTIKVVDTEYEGMGFAIPSATIKEIADDIIKQGYVSNRVRVGVTGRAISESTAEAYSVQPGIYIATFSDDSPLKAQDVQEGDIITYIDDVKVTSFSIFYSELAKHQPGDKVTLKIYRPSEDENKDGETFDITITLLEDNGETQADS
ncbi:MAG TPA: trypsin-like serine protease [Clostridiales bacterium]|nr:trypsin-like serine protease [Clostridiales bacterium]